MPDIDHCPFCHRRPPTKLCDFPTEVLVTTLDFKPYKFTCSRPMCDECATNIGHEVDICPHCLEKCYHLYLAYLKKQQGGPPHGRHR